MFGERRRWHGWGMDDLSLSLTPYEAADLRALLLAELRSREGEDDAVAKAIIARCAALLDKLDGVQPLYADFEAA
jgi:hypothetical protein